MGRHRTLLDLKGPAAPQTISHSDLLVSNKDGGDLEGPVGGSSSSSSSSSSQELLYPATGTMDGWMDGSLPPEKNPKSRSRRGSGEGTPGPSLTSSKKQNYRPRVVLFFLLAAVPPAEASGLGTLTLLRGAARDARGPLYCCDITRPRRA